MWDERRLDVKAQANPSWEEQELEFRIALPELALLCREVPPLCPPPRAACCFRVPHASVCPMLPCAPCFRVPHASVCPMLPCAPCFRVPHASVCPMLPCAPCLWPPTAPHLHVPPAQRGPLPVPVLVPPRYFRERPAGGAGGAARGVHPARLPLCVAAQQEGQESGEGGRARTQGGRACCATSRPCERRSPRRPPTALPRAPPVPRPGREAAGPQVVCSLAASLSLTRQGAP